MDKLSVPSPFAESDSRTKEEIKKPVSQVPADETQKNCPVCGEVFEQVYDEDQDEWMFKDALISPRDKKIFHVHCYHEIGDNENNGMSSSSEGESSSDSSDSEQENNASNSNGHSNLMPLDMPPLEDITPLRTKRIQPEDGNVVSSDNFVDQSKKPRVVE